MKCIIDWETLDNEEICNSTAPLGVGSLGGETPIILVGDRNSSDGCGSSNRLEYSTTSRHTRDESTSSWVIKTLDETITDPAFDIELFEDVIEIWNYDYGGL